MIEFERRRAQMEAKMEAMRNGKRGGSPGRVEMDKEEFMNALGTMKG